MQLTLYIDSVTLEFFYERFFIGSQRPVLLLLTLKRRVRAARPKLTSLSIDSIGNVVVYPHVLTSRFTVRL